MITSALLFALTVCLSTAACVCALRFASEKFQALIYFSALSSLATAYVLPEPGILVPLCAGVLLGTGLKRFKFGASAGTLGRYEYAFCPKCGAPIGQKTFEGIAKQACLRCDFVHWNNPITVGVAVIPSAKGYVLVRRKIEPKAGFLCLPGGFGDPFEHPEQTAIREAFEETGLKIELDRLLGVQASRTGNQVLIFYLAKPVTDEPTPGSDALEAGFYTLDDMPSDIAFESHCSVLDQLRKELANRQT